MKRKILCTILAIVTLTAMAGCDIAELTGKGNDITQANLNPAPADDPEPDINIVNDENEYEGVSNNGSQFVGVDGKIYFRQYGDYAIPSVASLRHFLVYGEGGYGSSICYFTPDNPDNIVAVTKEEDQGQGELYYYDNYIYSTRYEWENGMSHPVLYRANLSTGDLEDVGYGYIRAVSEDGRYIVTDVFNVDTGSTYTIYDAGKSVGSYAAESANVYRDIIAVDSSNLFFYLADVNTCDGSIYQYDFVNKKMYLLDNITAPEGLDEYISYTVIKNGVASGNKLSFTLCYCEGNIAYVEDAYDISVDINSDANASSDVPLFNAQSAKSTGNLIGKAADNLQLSSNLLSLELSRQGENGYSRAVQCAEKVYDKTYVIVADCFYSAQWNQAENETYDLLDVDYYYFDDNNTTPVLFNDNNPTNNNLMVKAWLVGKKGETPEKLLFQHASLSGPEGPQEFDPILYTAEFSDNLVFEHLPENGDLTDPFDKDDMAYMTKYYSTDFYSPFVETLEAGDEITHYKEPKEDWNDPNSPAYTFLHIGFDRNGKINYVRPVIMD